jgi:hypothetical protein
MNVNLVMFAFEAYTPISVVLLSFGMIISPSLFLNNAPHNPNVEYVNVE